MTASIDRTMSTQLEYGSVGTRFGVVVDEHADGGVLITIPFISRAGIPTLDLWWERLVERFTSPRSYRRRRGIPRAIIEITQDQCRFTDYGPEGTAPEFLAIQTFPRREVSEFRLNRYSPGLYFRISGMANFDILSDLDPLLLRWLDQVIGPAMIRTAPQPVVPPTD